MTGVLLRIALRNLRQHWVRTVVVGLLLMLGTFLVVVGSGLLGAVEAGMQRSIVGSLAGDVQVYSADAKDPLELYGSIAMGMPDLGRIDNVGRLSEVLGELPEVEAIVPEGVSRSVVTGKSTLDVKLDELRRAIDEGDDAGVAPLVAHIRQIIGGLEAGLDKLERLASDSEELEGQRADIRRAMSDAFWQDFARDPRAGLEFLDNKIAPLGIGSGMYLLTYLGTDLQAFQRHFELFEIVRGQMVPPGQRGFLFNENNYERFIKHKTARRFDFIERVMDDEGRTIAGDEALERVVERMARQYATITDELSPEDGAAVAEALRRELKSDEQDLGELVRSFLTLDDENFRRRRDLFYAEIAPRIRLYRFAVGDTLTLYGQTLSGYTREVNVKIYGVFHFRGLQKSTLAGVHHLMDLVTFRELYGLSDAVTPEEIAALTARSGIEDIDRDGAEDALFGGDDALVDEEGDTKPFDPLAGADLAGRRAEAEARARAGFTQEEIDEGPALNAAVFLAPGVDIDDAIARIEAHTAERGLRIQAVSWRDASGLIGQMTVAMDLVFIAAIVIIFVVAIIIIVTSLVMSTMDRLRELGTMRAIGAPPGFVVRMLAIEGGAMAVVFGLLGALLGAGFIGALGSVGIAARTDLQYFLFGGERLYPALQVEHLLWALVAIVVATVVSTLYPALIAARVQPIEAMQAKE